MMKDAKNIRFGKFKEEDRKPYLALFQEVFGHSWSKQYFHWKYKENPFNPDPMIYTAKDQEGRLIGARSMLPTEVVCQNKTYKALQAGDAMIKEAFRGRGLYTELTAGAIEEAKKQGYDLILNFPNANSFPILIKKGWHPVGETSVHIKILKPLAYPIKRLIMKTGGRTAPLPQRPGNYLGPLTEEAVHKEHEAFFREQLAGTHHQRRSLPYLQWKYSQNPEEYYPMLCFRAGGILKGIAVLKLHGTGKLAIGEILEWAAAKELEKPFLTEVLRYAKANRLDLLKIWNLKGSGRDLRAFKRKGFMEKKQGNFLIWVLSPGLEELKSPGDWHILRGDTDVI